MKQIAPPQQRALLLGGLVVACILVFWLVTALLNRPRDIERAILQAAPAGQARFAVSYTESKGAPRMVVGTHPISGEPITASCTTCHNTRLPDATHGAGNPAKAFHQGLVCNHDHLACLACHGPNNYDELHLADGKGVLFKDAMDLCAQCHSKQKVAYDNGAHGGMNGYWDLSRGPRVRHVCVDCHDPHAPRFPQMQPSFKAKERFLDAPHDSSPAGESHEQH